jgi:hypothetical protein
MASQTQGIQQLLAAEKRAAEKVSEARKRKKIFSTIEFSKSTKSLILIIFYRLLRQTKTS